MLEKFHRKYIEDRNFYKRYIALALPMIIQNAVTNLVSFLDNIMVGQLGTEQMSGVAIVNQLIFVYNLAVFGAVLTAPPPSFPAACPSASFLCKAFRWY